MKPYFYTNNWIQKFEIWSQYLLLETCKSPLHFLKPPLPFPLFITLFTNPISTTPPSHLSLSLSLSRLLQRSNIFFSRNKQNGIKKGVVFDPSLHNLSLLLYLGRGCLPPPRLSPSTLSGLHHSGAEHGWLLVVCVERQHFKKARRDLLFWFENGAGHWRWVPLWGLQEQCSIWCRLECH